MNDDAKKLVLVSLGALVAEKRARVNAVGMMNANTDEVTRMRLSMDYAQAQSDLMNAESALRAAMNS